MTGPIDRPTLPPAPAEPWPGPTYASPGVWTVVGGCESDGDEDPCYCGPCVTFRRSIYTAPVVPYPLRTGGA